MPVYPQSQMYTPQATDSPWVAGLKKVASALGWNDPNAVMGVGMPMGSPTSLAGEATAAAVPSMEAVGASEVPQTLPSSDAVEGLVNGMKARLNQIPTAANKYQMPTAATPAPVGNSTFDILNPATQNQIESMYQQARPTIQQMKNAGAFGTEADRTVGNIGGMWPRNPPKIPITGNNVDMTPLQYLQTVKGQ